MSFFRKAFNKLAPSPDSNGTVKTSPSTTALPAGVSVQHEGNGRPWDGLPPPPRSTLIPIRKSNMNSISSPPSNFKTMGRDTGFKPNDSPKSPRNYRPAMPMPIHDESPPRLPRKDSSSFPPFLPNLSGFNGIPSPDIDLFTRDYSESNLSFPLPTPEPLSSNASTPVLSMSTLPSSNRRTRGRHWMQNTSAENVAHSLTNITYIPSVSSGSLPSTVMDATVAKRLSEAGEVARRSAAISPEVFNPEQLVPRKDHDLPIPFLDDGYAPSIHVEKVQPSENKRAPSPASTNALDNDVVVPDLGFFFNQPLTNHLAQGPPNTDINPSIDNYSVHLEKHDAHMRSPIENTETKVSDAQDSVIDHYVGPYQTDAATQQLYEELQLLRSQLARSQDTIEALSEEKLRMMQSHRQDVLRLSNSVGRLEQNEVGYRAQLEFLGLENERVNTEKEEVVQQLKFQIEEYENLERLNKDLQTESMEFRDFKLKIRDNELTYQQLFKEKDTWQSQMDSIQHRLTDAERRARCLDTVTRQKYEARAYGSGSVGRSTKLHFSPHVKGPSMDVINTVTVFNEEILQAASYISEHFEETPSYVATVTDKERTRAHEIWGSRVVSMLQQQARLPSIDPNRINLLLLQNCLEVFLTHWCVQIAEGWYPKQVSFSDILVELNAQPASSTYGAQGKQVCGKQVRVILTESATPDFAAWVKDVIQDLTSILAVGGVRMPVPSATLLPSKIEPLLKLAYNMRLALAERDICGGLEISAPPPDVPFHAEFMEDAEESALQKSRKKKADRQGSSWLEGGFIAGTNGIGLKRTLNGQPGAYEMVLKPKVSLIRVLESVF